MAHHSSLLRSLQMLTLAVIAISSVAAAHAEGGCPDGSFPIGGGSAGWQGCAPMGGGDDDDDGYGSPPQPQEVWESRWGAIANGNGAFGAIENQTSQEAAEAIALERCRNSVEGGAVCTLEISYYDQCAALAWGQKGTNAYRGPDEEENKRKALESCQKRTTGCAIYYSGCSLPVRVR